MSAQRQVWPNFRPISEDESWVLALKPAEFTVNGDFQDCACDDCRLAAAELTDLTVGYDD